MPWKQRKALDERRDFIKGWKCAETSLAELCRRYEVRRPNGYKWLERYEREGEAGLEEHRRAPLQHPQAMQPECGRCCSTCERGIPVGDLKLRA